jgi:hypothetical protein
MTIQVCSEKILFYQSIWSAVVIIYANSLFTEPLRFFEFSRGKIFEGSEVVEYHYNIHI